MVPDVFIFNYKVIDQKNYSLQKFWKNFLVVIKRIRFFTFLFRSLSWGFYFFLFPRPTLKLVSKTKALCVSTGETQTRLAHFTGGFVHSFWFTRLRHWPRVARILPHSDPPARQSRQRPNLSLLNNKTQEWLSAADANRAKSLEIQYSFSLRGIIWA